MVMSTASQAHIPQGQPRLPPFSVDPSPSACQMPIADVLNALDSDSRLSRDKVFAAIPSMKPEVINAIRSAMPERLDSDNTWWSIASALDASRIILHNAFAHTSTPNTTFAQTLLSRALPFISHSEPRVRSATAALCGAIAATLGAVVWEETSTVLLTSVGRNFDLDDEQRLHEAERIAQNDTMISHASPRARGLRMVHETEGWRGLETSLLAIGEVISGCGAEVLSSLSTDKVHADTGVEAVVQYIGRARTHPNRFVRESGIRLLISLVDATVAAQKSDFLIYLAHELSTVLTEGLEDNWSQVRYVASVATRKLMSSLDAEARRECYPQFLPRMCLNRHYVAEGVRSYSQTTWKETIGADGRVYLVRLIQCVISFYETQCNANNHAVREAACQSLAEVSTRLDANAVRPYVPRIVKALIDCFKDESWPVRDHACSALAAVTSHFGDETERTGRLNELYELFRAHLADNIVSVRENTAVSVVQASTAFDASHPILGIDRLQCAVVELLPRIKDQPVQSFSPLSDTEGCRPDRDTGYGAAAKLARDNDVSLHTGQVMYSCGSLAPKLRRGGGCMDHGFSRPKAPWEETDGGARLWRELSRCDGKGTKIAGELFPQVVAAVKSALEIDFAHSTSAQEVLWRCIADSAPNLPKTSWTSSIIAEAATLAEISAKSANQRASSAARAAIAAMRRAVGFQAYLAATAANKSQ